MMSTRDRTTTHVQHALGALERLRASKLRELRAVEKAIRHLADTMSVGPAQEQSNHLEYKGVSILEAAKHWVTRIGAPQSTRDIAEALVSGGIATRSRDFVSTVYATLAHASDFRRTSDGRWALGASDPRDHLSSPTPP